MRQVQVVRGQNAQVQILGQTLGAGGGTVVPTTASQSLTFTVLREVPGLGVTVPFVVTDETAAPGTSSWAAARRRSEPGRGAPTCRITIGG